MGDDRSCWTGFVVTVCLFGGGFFELWQAGDVDLGDADSATEARRATHGARVEA